jgi:CPA1 family monovalent cation:H+ antiporter
MQTIKMVLLLLFIITVSGFIARLPRVGLIPLPLIQIAMGAGFSYFTGIEVVLEPDIFFLLFIPPLLFLDGRRIPKGAFFHDLRPILTLAVGLVLFTVLGVGFLIDWLIPSMPVAVAFALAAILSPTDPVAVSAITAKSPLAPRLMHILEGESLLNDASGLVCFRFAVAAALTGTFSLAQASLSFILVALGGVAIGVAVSWTVSFLNQVLVRMMGEDRSVRILMEILIPFGAYLAAERLHVSGILAAAAAGIAMHYADRAGRPSAATRMQRGAVWDTMQMVLNGTMFVLLGEQLPRLLRGAEATTHEAGLDGPWVLGAYVLLLGVALTVLRLIWVWASLKLTIFPARQRRGEAHRRSFHRTLLISAVAGVRGTITLAGILTLPLTLSDGTPFPARDLAIFLAMGVILLSLVSASVALPLLASKFDFAPVVPLADEEIDARSALGEAAIRSMEEIASEAPSHVSEVRAQAASHLVDQYRRRLDYAHIPRDELEYVQELAQAERELRTAALKAERDELYRLRISRQIDDTLHDKLLREIDMVETSLCK